MAREMSDFSCSRIEPLTGDNYHIWEMKVSAVLRSKKLFKAVIEADEPPDLGEAGSDIDNKTREAWEAKNNEAFTIIIVTLSPEQAGLFVGKTNAKTVWNELKEIHAGNVEDLKIDVTLELKNIKMKGNETVDSYITRARNISTRCASLGQIISEREIVYHVVRGLNEKFEAVASVLRPQRSAKLEEIRQTLKEEETRINQRNGISMKSNEAYKATASRGSRKQGQWEKKCFVCGKAGHLAKVCWHRNTKKESHNNYTKPNDSKYQGNHYRDKNGGKKMENAGSANSKQREERAFMANNYSQLHYDEQECEIEVWNLDSGSTSHMTPRRDWLENVKPESSQINLAGNNKFIQAKAKGDLNLAIVEEGEEKLISIKDVLYVPELRTNLLSVKSIVSKGNTVVFDQTGAKIFDSKSNMLAMAREEDNLYTLETKKCSETEAVDCLLTDENKDNKIYSEKELWHKRLGHINEEYLDAMNKKNMVQGLEFKPDKLGLCEACVMGKFAQKAFHRAVAKTVAPLELVHMDLCGPLPHESLGGSKYIHVFVDSYSRRIFTNFLRTKDEAFESFVAFKNRRETELGCKLIAVRTDNGREFVNKAFEEYFTKFGIKHQRTVPYSPQSNGIAERCNRTLMEGARTLLQDAKLPEEFWAEAVATTAYLKNCSPAKGEDKTAMEKWNGKIPSVSHLRIFGCIVYYHIPKARRHKLDATAKRGIFVGYSIKRAAYRIYDIEEQNVIEARSVQFDEYKKGGILLKAERQSTENFLKIYLDEENEESEEEKLNENNEENGREETQDEDNNNNLVPETPRRGRKPGSTNERIRILQENKNREREEKLVQQGVRRSERLKNKQINMCATKHENIPRNYEEAIYSTHSEEWIEAMNDEIQSLQNHEVWTLTSRPLNAKVLKSKWVFTQRENQGGMVERRKARLVVAGYNQKLGVDYEESFAPVIHMESLRILFSLASHLNLTMRIYDVKTAYLHGTLNEEVYMEQPEGFIVEGEESKVCKLEKSLYGLPQSGHCWNNRLNQIMKELGMTNLHYEPCIYFFKEGENLLIVGVYVDDLIIFGTSNELISNFVKRLQDYIDLRNRTEIGHFIGLEIMETEEGFHIMQSKYIEKLLNRYGLKECNPVFTPADCNQDLDKCQDSSEVDKKLYQGIVGALMFLAVGSRPDIAYSVCRISQYNSNPREIHLTAAKRIIRYLKGTKNYGLQFDRDGGTVSMCTDAGWCTAKEGKSFSGYSVKIGNNLVGWKSVKQRIVALSTCEAELMAMCDGVQELKWIVGFLSELEMEMCIQLPVVITTDSKSAMDWLRSCQLSNRTKHLNRKCFFVKDEIRKGNVELKHVPSKQLEADIFTKALPNSDFFRCATSLGLKETFSKVHLAEGGNCE